MTGPGPRVRGSGIMPPEGCPSRGELFGFLLGNLPRPAFDRVAGHVEHCAACETALASFDSLADPLVLQLRGPADETATTTDLADELLSAARSAVRRGRAGDGAPLSWPRHLGKFELLE